jgi:hypothetical protein
MQITKLGAAVLLFSVAACADDETPGGACTGDAVLASVSKGALSVTADYVFSVAGGCHVSKVSGPDTVTLQ